MLSDTDSDSILQLVGLNLKLLLEFVLMSSRPFPLSTSTFHPGGIN